MRSGGSEEGWAPGPEGVTRETGKRMKNSDMRRTREGNKKKSGTWEDKWVRRPKERSEKKMETGRDGDIGTHGHGVREAEESSVEREKGGMGF
ncbi:hypothetical protein NDU88_004858 [Pleurodeles waltl]|uniref:Uncharacterized protein n=1 Tax=Pleurodeles waltl TaxID=8319 RepID=A0AAV7L128_PLEWA|nr:hypothetical protein NDU88_004858 [Pleurodeles waltl]